MSMKRYKNFLDYWDSRFDENEKVLNNYPQLANFTFRECNKLWDVLHADYAALEASHNALLETVKALRNLECGIPEMGMLGAYKIITEAARAEVDRLIAKEG